jgi:hypothetical protein
VWVRDDPQEGFAYASVRGRTVLEYAGDREALETIVRFLLGSGDHQVVVPPVAAESGLDRMLLDYASGFSVAPAGMVRVVSLARVLEAYQALLSARLAGASGSLIVRASDTGAACVLGAGGAGRADPETGGPDTLEVSRTDLARLLFGPFPPSVGAALNGEVLRRALPLPLYWHALSHV